MDRSRANSRRWALATMVIVASGMVTITPSVSAAIKDADLRLGFADSKLRDDGSYSDQVTLRAELDGGGSLYIRFVATNVAGAEGRAELRARVSPAGSETYQVKVRRSKASKWKSVSNRLYADLGSARIEGRVGRLSVQMEDKDFRLQLEVVTDHAPLRPTGGSVRDDGEHYVTTVLVPRGRLTGRIEPADGAAIEFTGIAYADVRQGNIQPDELADRWVHLLDIGPKTTFAASALSRPDAKGSFGHAWMMQASDSRLPLYSPRATVTASSVRTDKKNDYKIPGKILLNGKGHRAEIQVTKLRERKYDLAALGSLERFVVERFMQPWSYRHDASYTTSAQTSKRTLNYVYQQLR
jgi:hypothetical protein